jgi:hypothetical protein
MADLKISQLTSATTPLAGTEVLPIVQSSSTKKVATDDLTVKNVRSNATTGILQIAGPGTNTTRVMTTPNANFTAARTDAAQTFTGNQTFSNTQVVTATPPGVHMDASSASVSVSNAASISFSDFSGMLLVSDIGFSGSFAVLACGGGGTAVVSQTVGSYFTNTSGAGTFRFYYDAGLYKLENQSGGATTFNIYVIKTRNGA